MGAPGKHAGVGQALRLAGHQTLCRSELARDGITAAHQPHRVAWIASKLAPTDFLLFGKGRFQRFVDRAQYFDSRPAFVIGLN